MPDNTNTKPMVMLLVVAVLAIILYSILTMPDRRTATQRVSDAIETLPEGADKAVRELEQRTPGEKLGDAVKDAGEDIKRNTDNE